MDKQHKDNEEKDYSGFSREELIEIIRDLSMMNDTLIKERETDISMGNSWSGNLGHWYWNVKNNTVVFNPLKVTVLGYSMDEIPENVSYQFFTEKLHPEDYQRVMDAMLMHIRGETAVYEAEYRIATKSGEWKWFYDRGKITHRDDSGKPIFVTGIVFDVTERKKKTQELEEQNRMLRQQSTIDPLTEIKKRRQILEELMTNINAAIGYNIPLSIAIFDIDNFKNVNDTKGHVTGDKVIAEVARMIESGIRGMDAVGRYGGEEFLTIFPNTLRENAVLVCERIRKTIEATGLSDNVRVTISAGVAGYNGEEMMDFIAKVDRNLYGAKNNGRNRIE